VSIPLRAAGILFIIAGLAGATSFALSQDILSSVGRNTADQVDLLFVIQLVLAEIEALVLVAAYITLYFLKPRGRLHWLFLLAALGHVIDASRILIPAGAVYGEIISVVGTIGAGIYVMAGRRFTLIPSLIFLVTVIVGLVPILIPLFVPGLPTSEAVFLYLAVALFAASGVAMIVGSTTVGTRTRLRATE
jgi:hypothetical protein